MTLSARTCTAGLALVAVLGAAGHAGRAQAGDGVPAGGSRPEAGPVESALARLASPYLAEREEAVADLAASLPASRSTLLAEFRVAKGPRRSALATALGTDGAPETLAALLDAFTSTDDPAVTAAVWRSLVRHADAVQAALSAGPPATGAVAARVEVLRTLLRRARIEAFFLSKKSRSGYTGFYRGQFTELKSDRELALRILLAILADSGVAGEGRAPGELPGGTYRYLLPLPFLAERLELRDLAANAVGELAVPGDGWVVEALKSLYVETLTAIRSSTDWRGGAPRGRLAPMEGLLDAMLATLARLTADPASSEDGDLWQRMLNRRVADLERRLLPEVAASLLARMGNYEAAITLYIEEAESPYAISIAYPRYNIACANAMWARDLEATDPKAAAKKRAEGIEQLRKSVEAGFVDWPWMEQDRDLDAIRGEPEYKALLKRIQEQFRAPVGGGQGLSGADPDAPSSPPKKSFPPPPPGSSPPSRPPR